MMMGRIKGNILNKCDRTPKSKQNDLAHFTRPMDLRELSLRSFALQLEVCNSWDSHLFSQVRPTRRIRQSL